jgi:hypothetical protein
MRFASLTFTLITLLFGSVALSAQQCPDVDASAYGEGCSPVFTPPTLSGSGDSTACTVSVTLDMPPGCCNTFAVGRLLIVGVLPADLPFPELGPNCTLLVEPLIILSLPNEPETLTFNLPSGLPLAGVSVYTQGVVEYFTTIGLTTEFALSNGMRLDFN